MSFLSERYLSYNTRRKIYPVRYTYINIILINILDLQYFLQDDARYIWIPQKRISGISTNLHSYIKPGSYLAKVAFFKTIINTHTNRHTSVSVS